MCCVILVGGFSPAMTRQELIALRESCTPKLYRRDMAARMGISYTYLQHMEGGRCPFAEKWQKRFMEELARYNASPQKENKYTRRWRLYRESLPELTPKEASAIELGA